MWVPISQAKTNLPAMRFHSLRLLATAVLVLFLAATLSQAKVKLDRVHVGFGDRYLVGSWTPLRLDLTGSEKEISAIAEFRFPDGDGVSTEIRSAPFSLPAKGKTQVEVLVRIGQLDAPVEVRLFDIGARKQVAKRTFVTRRELDDGGVAAGESATARMIVEISPTSIGASAVDAEKSSELWYTQNIIGRVSELAALPRVALAYESVDTVLVSTSDRDAWSGMRADDSRVLALVEWVEQGGRMILYCGANADLVVGSGGPLATLAPSEFTGPATVGDLRSLENYVGGNEPLPKRGRLRIAVPGFGSVRGDVELEVGRGDSKLPLIVRTRHGLGQVVFVGLDIDAPPLRNWESRTQLVEKNLAFASTETTTDTNNYYYSGPSDLVMMLQGQLDAQLENSGIRTPPFMAIAGLVVLYILLIGPGDYFFVKHVLKRMELTWITFPTIVIVTCVAAYWYANYLKGDSLRINQVEIVDVDNTTGRTRGAMWTHLFSPNPSRYYLTLDAKTPTGETDEVEQSSVAWLGKTEGGLGGMSNDAGMMLGAPVYGWSPNRELLSGMPIEVWSTETFVTRWDSETNARLDSDLARTDNDLVVGVINNPTRLDLQDCKLVYGSWAWRLGSLPAGGSVEVLQGTLSNTRAAPKKLRNLFKEDFNFDVGQGSYYEKQHLVQQLGLQGLSEMMMFYDALGGYRQSEQWNRYQHFVDLSHALDGETAMLVGVCSQPRSELVRVEKQEDKVVVESMRGDKDYYLVMYRYVLPVKPVPDEPDSDDS